jgi:hypothetical protein
MGIHLITLVFIVIDCTCSIYHITTTVHPNKKKNMNLLTAKAGSTGDLSWMAFKEELYFISINNGEHSDLVV